MLLSKGLMVFLLMLAQALVQLVSADNYPYSYYRRTCYRPYCFYGYHAHHRGHVGPGKVTHLKLKIQINRIFRVNGSVKISCLNPVCWLLIF